MFEDILKALEDERCKFNVEYPYYYIEVSQLKPNKVLHFNAWGYYHIKFIVCILLWKKQCAILKYCNLASGF